MKIVYVSGIDGCGKTTQARMLVERFNRGGTKAEYRWLRWEPSLRSVTGWLKRLGASAPRGERQGSTQAREDSGHTKWRRVKSRLMSVGLVRWLWLTYAARDYRRAYRRASRGWRADIVVLDRYTFDFVVDQALNCGVATDRLLGLLPRSFLSEIRRPDFGVIIDLPAQVGYARKQDGTALRYLQEREAPYKAFALAGRVLHVDGTRSPDVIHEEIFEWLSQQCASLR